jgi:hypothetical protein
VFQQHCCALCRCGRAYCTQPLVIGWLVACCCGVLQLEAVGLKDPKRRLMLLVTPKYVDILSQRRLERVDRVTMLLAPLTAAKLECGSFRGMPERLHAVDEEGEAQTMLLEVSVLRVWARSGCVGLGWPAFQLCPIGALPLPPWAPGPCCEESYVWRRC